MKLQYFGAGADSQILGVLKKGNVYEVSDIVASSLLAGKNWKVVKEKVEKESELKSLKKKGGE